MDEPVQTVKPGFQVGDVVRHRRTPSLRFRVRAVWESVPPEGGFFLYECRQIGSKNPQQTRGTFKYDEGALELVTPRRAPPIDLKKLECDLASSAALAIEAASSIQDEGTANFDAVVIRLPRAREARVSEIATKAGLHAFRAGAGTFHLSVNGRSHRARRTVQVERLHDAMKGLGWDVSLWYQLD